MEENLKILMLEDVPADVGLAERVLRKEGIKFTLHCVDTRDAFIDAIRNFGPDVILSDHSMPQFDSTQALKICRRTGLRIPFILVTGTVSEEFAVSCLKQGADDYILKGNLSRLPSAILTSLKKREDQRQRLTAEIALRSQNEKLIKINKELDHFVYSASHNLRAPLMSVLGLLNVANEDLKVSNMRHFPSYLRMMGESVQQLDETLKEIIDYSRNARSEVLKEHLNARKLVQNCIDRLRYLEEAEGVETKIEIKGDGMIYSDEYRLSVILTNLISNGIKYRDYAKEKSTVAVTIDTTALQTEIILEDNGIGIPAAYLPHIFDMFYRGTERSRGAGLGLYIAKETIENLGGSINVESEINVGTRINVQLLSA